MATYRPIKCRKCGRRHQSARTARACAVAARGQSTRRSARNGGHDLRRGDVLRVRDVRGPYRFYNGLADVATVDGNRVQVFFRAHPMTEWFEVHGSRLNSRHYKFEFTKQP